MLLKQNAISSALKELNDSQTNPKSPSYRSLAKKYSIPETTFRHAIKNDGSLDRSGLAKVLTNHEEQQLVGYCLNMQRLGFGLARSGVNQCIIDIVQQVTDPTPLKKVDQTGFIINPTLQKVIAKKDAHQVHQVSYKNSQKHISVCTTISAADMYILPLIIYKGKHMIPGLLNGVPAGSVMEFTDTGYMKKCLFQKYIKHFICSIPSTCPVLLILDGHKSHISYACVSLCYNNNILLYAFLLHTTYILQPAELPFTHLKQAYDKASSNLDPNSTLISNKKKLLKTEIKTLNIRIEQLEAELKVTKDELKTFKSLGTCSLCLALKYPLPHTLQSVENSDQAVNQPEASLQKRKKRKTMSFSQLLTNETFLRLLKDIEEEAERKANENKQKKEAAVQK
ncbi:20853_t:CDS:2 [Cetraspora pellucida]|uniref:20853_t:CDS:1 n=1 Tax=Cetraspora pellucida TaxID=1433469 RepID=A0A9N9IMY4_9GLOM|nr:20853_t:CDS:2 [Cetraspora pellucida]